MLLLAVAAVLASAGPSASNSLLQAPRPLEAVRVPVANVWEAPNAGHLPLDPRVWPTPAVTLAQRLALVGRLSTQVLYGETVHVLARRGGWTKIAVPDQLSPLDRRGYPGWVLSWQLGPQPAMKVAEALVTVPKARLANGTEVGLGSEVPVGIVSPSATRALPRTRADLVRSAEQFLGLHYLWGGLSPWGYDCSGLTWAVYRAHGITIPRDAGAQFAAGTPVTLAQVQPGDLLFYDRPIVGHVAMYVGGGLMIESPNSRSEVRVVPVRRTGDFRGARRFM